MSNPAIPDEGDSSPRHLFILQRRGGCNAADALWFVQMQLLKPQSSVQMLLKPKKKAFSLLIFPDKPDLFDALIELSRTLTFHMLGEACRSEMPLPWFLCLPCH